MVEAGPVQVGQVLERGREEQVERENETEGAEIENALDSDDGDLGRDGKAGAARDQDRPDELADAAEDSEAGEAYELQADERVPGRGLLAGSSISRIGGL